MLAITVAMWAKIFLMSFLCFLLLLISLGKWSWLVLPRPVKQFDFYLAGPMRNYEGKNKAMFLTVATLLRDQGYTVFNPGQVNDDGMSFQECMRIDLDAVVNKCGSIAFLPGWRDSLGANAEAFAASVCGKDAFQVRLIKNDTTLRLKKISLAKRTLPYKTKKRS